MFGISRHEYSVIAEACPTIGSGAVVMLGVVAATVSLLALGHMVGWDPTWRAVGVTPLQPPFYDMHIINDYAACARKGFDAYAPHACNKANFNIPPTWLWLGFLGVDGSDAPWLSAAIIAAAIIVMLPLFRGRSWLHGVVALGAMISPSVMMGVERANLDLLILALVGAAALIYEERRAGRVCGAIAFLCVGIALKLFPIFCISLMARFSRQTFIFACVITALSLALFEIRRDTCANQFDRCWCKTSPRSDDRGCAPTNSRCLKTSIESPR